jgi:predicted dehydrogenase
MASWIGASPRAVTARLRTVRPDHAPVEDDATIDLKFPTATGRIELSWAAPSRANDGEIVGSKGSIRIEDHGIVMRTERGEVTRAYGERLSDSSYHPEWFAALFTQILADDSRVEGRRNFREASMLLTTLFQAYEHPAGTSANVGGSAQARA